MWSKKKIEEHLGNFKLSTLFDFCNVFEIQYFKLIYISEHQLQNIFSVNITDPTRKSAL